MKVASPFSRYTVTVINHIMVKPDFKVVNAGEKLIVHRHEGEIVANQKAKQIHQKPSLPKKS